MNQFSKTNDTAKSLKENFNDLSDFEALQIAVGIENNIIQEKKISEESKIAEALSVIANALKK